VWISHSRTEISRLVIETRRELPVRRSGFAECNPWYVDRAALFVSNPSSATKPVAKYGSPGETWAWGDRDKRRARAAETETFRPAVRYMPTWLDKIQRVSKRMTRFQIIISNNENALQLQNKLQIIK